MQFQCGTGGSTVEKPAKTQISIRLASHFVRAPNSGREFESPMRRELGAMTKNVERSLGSFLFPTAGLFRLNRALEEANKLRGELGAAEREKKEAKVTLAQSSLFLTYGICHSSSTGGSVLFFPSGRLGSTG